VIDQLWIVAHAKQGLTYALGNSISSAWTNALLIRHGVELDDGPRKRAIKNLQAEGWTAKRCQVILTGDERYEPKPSNRPHPLGEPVPGQHFTFVKELRETEYFAIVAKGTEDAVRAAVIEAAENYEMTAKTSRVVSREVTVRPVRTGHLVDKNRDDADYLRTHRNAS
jgi:hypothetical protein